MSPEVLRGEELNEKADVYSFAIVCWEIYERKEPFKHHTSYSKFVKAVCDYQERPPLPPDMHCKLKKLISDCWQDNPSLRPSFGEIIQILDDIELNCALGDDIDAQKLWIKIIVKNEAVPFNFFAKRMYHYLGMEPPDTNSIEYQCLQAIIAINDNREESSK